MTRFKLYDQLNFQCFFLSDYCAIKYLKKIINIQNQFLKQILLTRFNDFDSELKKFEGYTIDFYFA